MFCAKCGTQMEPDAKYCPSCGTAVEHWSESEVNHSIPHTVSESSPINIHQNTAMKRKGKPVLSIIIAVVLVLAAAGFAANQFVFNNSSISQTISQLIGIKKKESTHKQANPKTKDKTKTKESKQQEPQSTQNQVTETQPDKDEPVTSEPEINNNFELDEGNEGRELCNLAMEYTRVRPEDGVGAEITDVDGSVYTIHLFRRIGDLDGDTVAWYYIDANTGTGKDGDDNPVDFSDMDENDTYYEYILTYSSEQYYYKENLDKVPTDELRIARNEILARHGRRFNDQELQSYFDSKSWYNGEYSPEEFDEQMDDLLNDYEKHNIQIIKELEEERQ